MHFTEALYISPSTFLTKKKKKALQFFQIVLPWFTLRLQSNWTCRILTTCIPKNPGYLNLGGGPGGRRKILRYKKWIEVKKLRQKGNSRHF